MKIIAPKRLMESVFPTVRNGGIFNASSLDLQFARTKTLDSRITFTRASSGTYVGSDGLIKTATTNLALQSEDFSTSWGSNLYTITTNSTTAPNGAVTADKAVRDTSNAITSLSANVTVTASTAYNFSCFVKAAGWSKVGLREGASTGNYVTFDLATASIISSSGATGSVAAYPDGWYRISMQMTTVGAQTTYGMRIVPLPNNYASGTPSYSFAGDGTSGLYVWGAQLEQSSTVGEYIPTTSTINSAPRFDHNPTTGESLGLLVEEQRTNICLQSENFSTTWTLTDATVSTNTVIAPDGTQSADKITVTVTTGVAAQAIVKAASTTTYTFTLFVKGSISALSFTVDAGGPANRGICVFNLSTGSLTSTANSGSFTGTTGSITPYSDGWYRLILTTTTGTETTVRPRLFWTGTDTTLDVWGAQLETGAFPTSYIPTTTATVTRSADVASITGANFSSFYNQTEGTVFAAYDQPAVGCSIAVIDDETANNSIVLFSVSAANQRVSSNMLVASANQGRMDAGGTFTANVLNRAALAVSASGRGLSCNGSAVSTSANPSSMPSLSRLAIQGDSGFTTQKGGHIQRLTYWPTRLPNSTLQAVTQ